MVVLDVASAPRRYDVIVVGSGVAGLRAAIEAAEGGLTVALLSKDSAHDSNTDLAQGGVAVALSDEDQVGLHYHDTLAAGDGLCDETAVATMVTEGPQYITQLIAWGAQFDREGSRLAFTREAAHSARRILHADGDATGREILRALWKKASTLDRICFLPHTFSIDLILQDRACQGLMVIDESTSNVISLAAGAVVLATGGLGQIFLETTNPPQATGDGIAVAARAGALLRDMEFVQFHPTSLHVEGAPRFLLSEALRGEGGLLRTASGRRFMLEVDPRAELAPRDVVARAIFKQIGAGGDHVLLDLTHLEPGYLKARFPGIYAMCLKYGVDITRAPVPVAPAAHYLMGGVATDLFGRTTVPGLYAAGEVACTGVHGANRLASNSLLEGLVFGARTGSAIVDDLAAGRPRQAELPQDLAQPRPEAAPQSAPSARAGGDAVTTMSGVKEIAWRRLGIVRRQEDLASAIADLERILSGMARAGDEGVRADRAPLEAGNMASVALVIARSAMTRRESRGAHYRSDFPQHDDPGFGRSSSILLGMEAAAFAEGTAGRAEATRRSP